MNYKNISDIIPRLDEDQLYTGVYIHEIEFPDNCLGCCFLDESDINECYCSVNFSQLHWTYDQVPGRNGAFDQRPDRCPIQKVPRKHGRLIDADRLMGQIKQIDKTARREEQDSVRIGALYGIRAAAEAIMQSPTLIEPYNPYVGAISSSFTCQYCGDIEVKHFNEDYHPEYCPFCGERLNGEDHEE